MGSIKQPYWHMIMKTLDTLWFCDFQAQTWHVVGTTTLAKLHSLWQLTTLVANTSTWCRPSFFRLQDKFSITINLSGDSYLGLTINWNYETGYVDIFMPDYVPEALAKFKHPQPRIPQHAPQA